MAGHTPSNRAVSDVIAFVLTFSVIISAVGFIYIGGFDALGEVRDSEEINSGERTMRGVAETFEDIHRNGAPGRSIEVGVEGGSLSLRESTVEVTVEDSGGTVLTDRDLSVEALVFTPVEGGSTEYIYDTGAVFRVQGNGSLIRHRPVLSCTDQAAVVSIVKLRGDVNVGDAGAVRVTGERGAANLVYPDPESGSSADDAANLTLDFSNVYTPDGTSTNAWARFMRAENGWGEATDGTFYCDGIDRVFVRQTTIRLDAVY